VSPVIAPGFAPVSRHRAPEQPGSTDAACAELSLAPGVAVDPGRFAAGDNGTCTRPERP